MFSINLDLKISGNNIVRDTDILSCEHSSHIFYLEKLFLTLENSTTTRSSSSIGFLFTQTYSTHNPISIIP